MQRTLSLAALVLVACSDTQSATLGEDLPATADASVDAGADANLADAGSVCDIGMIVADLTASFVDATGQFTQPSYCERTPYYTGCFAFEFYSAVTACLTQVAAGPQR